MWSHAEIKDSQMPPSEAQHLFNSYWEWRISDSPQFATSVGFHDYDDLLNDMSMESFSARLDKCREFLDMVNELEPSLTNKTDIVNMKVLRYELETYMNFYDLKGFYQPVNYREGPHVDMEKLFGWMLLNTSQDYDVMIKRMKKIPLQMDQIIELMRAGVENNITYHAISMKNMNTSFGRFVVDDPKRSPLFNFFKDGFPASLTPEEINRIQKAAEDVIRDKVSPGYEKLLNYIRDEYQTREEIAITSIPRGQEFYVDLILFHTSTNNTAEEIQNIGFKEVERIEADMLKIIRDMGYENMTVQHFFYKIRNDSSNYYNNSDDMIAEFNNIAHQKICPELQRVFNSIPETKLKVVADLTPGRTGAYYERGSYDCSRPGIFYARIYYPESMPKFRMLSLSLHEGNPGHHLQRSYSIESQDFPFFRKVSEGGNYGMAPSLFPRYTYFAEGWALYAETLGFDMNLFSDPLERFGHYNEEMYRAARLVVDTGIHTMGWTKEEAVEYLLNHTAMSNVSAENEIDRYITWPGQALAYKMGQLKIQQLRSKAEEKLGELFNLKDFHDVILNSYGPMDVVEQEVQKWMASRKYSLHLQ